MRMKRTKAGLIAVALTVFGMLLGSVNCDSMRPSGEAAATIHQDHAASQEAPALKAAGHCSNDQHGATSHCAVHCNHSGAVIALNTLVSPKVISSRLVSDVSESLPNRITSTFRPPISA